MISEVGYAHVVSDEEFVQQFQMPRFLLECVEEAANTFYEQEVADAFERFGFYVDQKAAAGITIVERQIDENLLEMLGLTPTIEFKLPAGWKDQPNHPFFKGAPAVAVG
jgi:hypothetical protein